MLHSAHDSTAWRATLLRGWRMCVSKIFLGMNHSVHNERSSGCCNGSVNVPHLNSNTDSLVAQQHKKYRVPDSSYLAIYRSPLKTGKIFGDAAVA